MYASTIKCPECRATANFPMETLKDLPINRLIATIFEKNGLKLNIIPKKELEELMKQVMIFQQINVKFNQF